MKNKNQKLISLLGFIGVMLLFYTACKKETAPVLITLDITNISQSTAIAKGSISSDGGSEIITRGVCWSTEPNPTIADNITSQGNMLGEFVSRIYALTHNTTYYLRSYATNGKGTSYGNELSFSTDLRVEGNITDIEGNIYKTVTFQGKEWMAENLKTTKYSNGDPIATTNPPTLDISNENNPKYRWSYDSDATNESEYGLLYTAYVTLDDRGLCPTGWHVSTTQDWDELIDYFGAIKNVIGAMLKDKGISNWATPNSNATNETGFTALPAGFRSKEGTFSSLHDLANWWVSDESNVSTLYTYYITSHDDGLYQVKKDNYRSEGMSIRCVRAVSASSK